jgi:hypothetical protein
MQLWKTHQPGKSLGLPHLNDHLTNARRQLIRVEVSKTKRSQCVLLSDDDAAFKNPKKQTGNRGGRQQRTVGGLNAVTGVWKGDYPDGSQHVTPLWIRIVHPVLDQSGRALVNAEDDTLAYVMRSKKFQDRPLLPSQLWQDRFLVMLEVAPQEFEAVDEPIPSTGGPIVKSEIQRLCLHVRLHQWRAPWLVSGFDDRDHSGKKLTSLGMSWDWLICSLETG